MKRLIMIGGTMGVGKTSTGRALSESLPRCAFLDGDWCWTFRRDCFNEETKALVIRNIIHLLREYLRSESYETTVFVWVMHQQSIWDEILNGLKEEEFELRRYVLIAGREAFQARFAQDAERGIRDARDMEAAYARMPLYDSIKAVRISTDDRTAKEAAEWIRRDLEKEE